MSRRRLLAVTAVVFVIVLAGTGAVVLLEGGETTQDAETVDELAAEADQQRQTAVAAADLSGSLLATLGFGVALGLGVGLLGGTAYAYNNRGMR